MSIVMNRTYRTLLFLLVSGFLLGLLQGCSERAEAPPAAATAAAEQAVAEAGLAATGNPFFESWDTPYGIPPFDRIRDEHYPPAFERGIEEQRADVAAIRDNPSTAANTPTVAKAMIARFRISSVAQTDKNCCKTTLLNVRASAPVTVRLGRTHLTIG